VRILLLLLLGLGTMLGPASAATSAGTGQLLTVSDAWARATVLGQTGSGVFLHLTSQEDAQLIGASSLAAERVEIHEMRVANGMMTMRRIETLPLPAGKTIALDHEFHIMLIGLKQQLKVGQSVTLSLQWLDAQGTRHVTDVVAPVRALKSAAASSTNRGD